MRELVLNHASLGAGDRYRAIERLKDVISGMAALVNCGAAGSVLRSARDMTQIPCAPGFSLFEAHEELRKSGARDEYRFFARLMTKMRLLSDLGTEHRFSGCETRDIPPDDGKPLLFCALDDHIAVSFPMHPDWDRDRITVRFDELLADDTVSAESGEIDHLSRAGHAEPICRRNAETPIGSWTDLDAAARARFVRLTFASDCFEPLDGVPFSRGVAGRFLALLDILDRLARAFDGNGTRTPEGHEIYQDHFTGCRALFSDSSDTEKHDFRKELTFPHPNDPGRSLFCPWHGKISRMTLRLHYSWSSKAGEPVFVVYAGPKITKR